MKILSLAAVALAALLSACAIPRAGNTTADRILRNEPDRLIVVTVENSAETTVARAGSTPRGYDGTESYQASRVARATIAAIEREYDLESVAAWPIDVLHVH